MAYVLIVDDDQDFAETIAHVLRNEGYDVQINFDTESAFQNMKNKTPDLVLLDVRMPELNGLEVCKRLKSDPNRKHIPIIIFSAKTLDPHIEEGLKAGADEYITKPFNSSHLLGTLRKYL